MSLLRRQLILIPLSVAFGFFLAYVGFRNGLHRTVFGSPFNVGGGYNALGRIGPFNESVRPVVDGERGGAKTIGKQEVVPDGLKVKDLAAAVENRTLGFGKLFVVSLPGAAERKDAMVLSSSLSMLNIDWSDGASDTVQDQKESSEQPPSSWRAHIDAIRTTVERGSSAIVLADNLDWDIRLKEQMHTFALSARTLTQPLAVEGEGEAESIYADPSFPESASSDKVIEIPFEKRPTTVQPLDSAYGDDWDVLWLGHCGMQFPTESAPNLSKGRIILTPDPSIAARDTVSMGGTSGDNYTEQTRVYHHVYAPECALAYAVSQRGARRILYEASQRNASEGFESMLQDLCDGEAGSKTRFVCLTTQPSLFSRWRQGGERGSEHVRWSVRMNIGKYIRGDEREWVDQYPDGVR